MNSTEINEVANLTCYKMISSPTPGSYAHTIACYVFPIIFSVGIAGNFLNLLVLNSRGMKSKANYFLSSLALADFGFFIFMFMINLSNYENLANSDRFLNFYVMTKMSFTVLVNWFSSASIWFVVMVTVERLIVIRTPLRARSLWKHKRILFVILTIFLTTFILQLYNFVWLTPKSTVDCKNENRTVYFLYQIRPTDDYYRYKFVQVSMIATPFATVIVPFILLIVLNGNLLYHLRKSKKNLSQLAAHATVKNCDKENKVTLMVLLIVATFFLFNFPSAIAYGYSVIFRASFKNIAIYSFITNFMVTVNKSLNFWLYCLASESFRKRLLITCRSICGHKVDRSTETSMQATTRMIQINRKITCGSRGASNNNIAEGDNTSLLVSVCKNGINV